MHLQPRRPVVEGGSPPKLATAAWVRPPTVARTRRCRAAGRRHDRGRDWRSDSRACARACRHGPRWHGRSSPGRGAAPRPPTSPSPRSARMREEETVSPSIWTGSTIDVAIPSAAAHAPAAWPRLPCVACRSGSWARPPRPTPSRVPIRSSMKASAARPASAASKPSVIMPRAPSRSAASAFRAAWSAEQRSPRGEESAWMRLERQDGWACPSVAPRRRASATRARGRDASRRNCRWPAPAAPAAQAGLGDPSGKRMRCSSGCAHGPPVRLRQAAVWSQRCPLTSCNLRPLEPEHRWRSVRLVRTWNEEDRGEFRETELDDDGARYVHADSGGR